MKKLSLIIALVSTINLFGQKALDVKGDKITDSRIYITLNGTDIEYFTHSKTEDGKTKIKANQKFSLKDGNNCNIYMNWLNPLKYKIVWKDSILDDERDKAVNDFVKLLTAQFGTPVTSLNSTATNANLAKASQGARAKNVERDSINTKKGNKNKATDLAVPEDGFNSIDLTTLFIQLNMNIENLSESDRIAINKLIDVLKELDTKNAENISDKINNRFTDLFSQTDASEVKNMIGKCKDSIKKFERSFISIENAKTSMTEKIKDFQIDDMALNSLITLTINKFLGEVNTKLISDKALVAKLTPLTEIIEKSVTDKSPNPLTSTYYRVKNLSFDDGKKFETSLTITEFKYKSDTKEFVKEKDITTKKMTFERYDFFQISVSTGIFYSNTTLRGFGVKTNDDGKLAVTEDDINKNLPVTAVFLNFNFGTGSRYFAPLAQIGIDPTKKRPFLLIGGGFTIPSARLAISGGPVWIWNPTLDKLTVGQTVESTTDLEKDITYKFDMEPKGWYLGVQYNF